MSRHAEENPPKPYTKAEEDEFYRRIGRGPITVARPPREVKADEDSSVTTA